MCFIGLRVDVCNGNQQFFQQGYEHEKWCSVLVLSLVELWWMSLFYYLWIILHVWIRRPWYSRDSCTRCESAGYHRFITPRNLIYFIWDVYGYAWSHSNSCETHKKPF